MASSLLSLEKGPKFGYDVSPLLPTIFCNAITGFPLNVLSVGGDCPSHDLSLFIDYTLIILINESKCAYLHPKITE